MDDDIKKLAERLERNIALTEAIAHDVKKIKRQFWWSTVWGVLKLAFVIVPLVAAYLFVQPYLAQVGQAYQEVLGLQESVRGLQENVEALNDGAETMRDGEKTPEGLMRLFNIPGLEGLLKRPQ